MTIEITLPFECYISEERLKSNPYLIVVCNGTPKIFDSYESQEQAAEVNKTVRGTIITNPYYYKNIKAEDLEDSEEEQSPFSYYQN